MQSFNFVTKKKIPEQLETPFALETEALMALKRKKVLEKQLEQTDGTLTTIEFQLDALRNAQANQQVLQTMKNASTALKKEHNHMLACLAFV